MSELQKYVATMLINNEGVPALENHRHRSVYLRCDVDAARAADQQQIATLMSANAEYAKRHVEQLEQIRLLSERLARSEAVIRDSLAAIESFRAMSARDLLRSHLAAAHGRQQEKPEHVCGASDYLYAVYDKGLPRCPACVASGFYGKQRDGGEA